MGLNKAFPSAAANMKGRKKAFQRAFTKSGISLLLIALLEGGTCHSSAQRPMSLPVAGLARAPTSPPSLQSSSFRTSLLVTAENKTQRKHSLPVAAICVSPPPPHLGWPDIFGRERCPRLQKALEFTARGLGRAGSGLSPQISPFPNSVTQPKGSVPFPGLASRRC